MTILDLKFRDSTKICLYDLFISTTRSMNLAQYFRCVIRNEMLAIRTMPKPTRHHFESTSELLGDNEKRPVAVNITGPTPETDSCVRSMRRGQLLRQL